MSRFGRLLGSGIAKAWCDFDRSWSEPDMAYWEREQMEVRKEKQRQAEQAKRDQAYKRAFGIYPWQH